MPAFAMRLRRGRLGSRWPRDRLRATPTLRAELTAKYPNVTFTESAAVLERRRAGGAPARPRPRHRRARARSTTRVLAQVPELRVISKYGVGLDGLDIDGDGAARHQAGWTGGVNRRSVAELTLAFAIALLHRVPECDVALRAGQWHKLVGRQLTGRTVGIIGCGFVGQDLVRLLAPFECRVLAHDIRDYPEFYAAHRVTPVRSTRCWRRRTSSRCTCRSMRSTRGMIGAAELARMRAGRVPHQRRPRRADRRRRRWPTRSKRGHLAGAACDVFQMEPDANPRLLALPTFLGTPHIGGSTQEAQLAMGRAAIDGLETARVPGDGWPC